MEMVCRLCIHRRSCRNKSARQLNCSCQGISETLVSICFLVAVGRTHTIPFRFLTFSVFMVSFGFLCPRSFFFLLSNGKIFFISIIISLFIRTAMGFAFISLLRFLIHTRTVCVCAHTRSSSLLPLSSSSSSSSAENTAEWKKRNTRKPVFIFHSTFYSGVACVRCGFDSDLLLSVPLFVVLLFRLLCAFGIGINWIKA